MKKEILFALAISTVGFAFAQNKGFDTKNLDNKCKPCEDFNQFANGGWLLNNPIPGDQAAWGNFSLLMQKNQEKLKNILELLGKTKQSPGSNKQKLADFYAMAMDVEKANKDGYSPIKPQLDKINSITNRADLENIIALLHTQTLSVGFSFSSGQDLKDSKRVIGECGQNGLTLPDRDYYLNQDSRSIKIREELLKYITRSFLLIGLSESESKTNADIILDFETQLAKASLTRVEMRDPYAVYHLTSLNELNKYTPTFNWNNYLKNINCPPVAEINVAMPKFMRAFDSLLVNKDLKTWKTYLSWRLINEASPYLSEAFDQEHFYFHKKVLTGTDKQQDRWKRSVQATDLFLGDALGQAYTEQYFTADSKKRVLEMIANIKTALKMDIAELKWMSDSTKKRALEKLATFEDKIGYPEVWKDYSVLPIGRDSYYNNVLAGAQYEYRRQLNKIGKPVDRKEWQMTAPTINAYYNPLMNEIVFPAGILQPPFFDPQADDAINYGGMGAVIGHEITHGFDDQGAQFDADGNLKNWWTDKDLENFTSRAKCIINQFNSYTIQDSLHLNGQLVVGESIADLGGLTLAYYAFQNSLKGKPAPKPIDGFTADQRFFLGWAQVWATNMRPEMERLKLKTDPHPNPKFRVNGTLSNMDAFQKAFNCKEGDKMIRNKAEKCEIW
jgi:putative endopeptidase